MSLPTCALLDRNHPHFLPEVPGLTLFISVRRVQDSFQSRASTTSVYLHLSFGEKHLIHEKPNPTNFWSDLDTQGVESTSCQLHRRFTGVVQSSKTYFRTLRARVRIGLNFSKWWSEHPNKFSPFEMMRPPAQLKRRTGRGVHIFRSEQSHLS